VTGLSPASCNPQDPGIAALIVARLFHPANTEAANPDPWGRGLLFADVEPGGEPIQDFDG